MNKPGFTVIMPWAAPALKPLPELSVNERLTLKDVSLTQVRPAALLSAAPAAGAAAAGASTKSCTPLSPVQYNSAATPVA